ncbi:hypothetical protein ACFW6S_35325 [Streptomyces sp. NPDC058740]|uniref:hypothetical protein n=1 Tax=Streptomyces sp. NPDC058740 TaxID=3346619 RepID=UPI00367E9D69
MARTTFPPDLLDAQTSWITVYETLAGPCPADTSALRRRLIRLSANVYWHPYWERPTAGGRPELLLAARAVRTARAARARGEVTAA